MLKACSKWLQSGLFLAFASALSGCGAGLTKVVDAAADNRVAVQGHSGQAVVTPDSSTGVLTASARVGDKVNLALTASGGTGPYTWSLMSGSLPTGLSLSSGGTLSGVPTVTGTWNSKLEVVDSSPNGGAVRTTPVVFNVTAKALAIATSTLPSATTGAAYTSSLQATGGTPSYRWSLKSGSTPAGLSLSSDGTVSGTPTTAGTTSFTAAVADAGSPVQQVSRTISITVLAPAATSLQITSGTLTNALVGQTYAATLAASGGTPAYRWSVASGSLPAGLTLSTAGAITGTPTTSGTSTFTVRTTDSATQAQSTTRNLSLTVAPSALQITTSSLSNGQSGSSYSAALAASGGTPAYTWSLASGALPAGLALSSTGTISGTPTAAGTSSFQVKATDAASQAQAATQTLSLTIVPSPLKITTAALSSGRRGASYAASVSASGGTPAIKWSVASGTLPVGLSLDPAGTISGTPTASGTSNFAVRATDSAASAQVATQNLSLTIAATTLGVTTGSLSSGSVESAYSASLAASGGTPAYTWTIAAGSLPYGVSLSSSGTLSGRPQVSGTFAFAVRVTDSAAQTATQNLSLTVAAPLVVTTTLLSNGTSGSVYSAALTAFGGAPAYTWSFAAGSLPSGLSLSNSGIVSGTPTVSGTFNFAVRATDTGAQTATQSLSLTIASNALKITTTSLGSGSTGTAYSTALGANGGTPSYLWSVASGTLPAGLSLSSTGTISGTPTASGTSTFAVRATDSSAQAQTVAQSLSITVAGSPLTITTSGVAGGQSGTAYATQLSATGGTPSYTWSITSGSLPSGLTLGASTGVVQGTPSASGNYAFTYQVADNSSPQQQTSATATISVSAAAAQSGPTTWFIRVDGGTRFDASSNPTGQCDGKADVGYGGVGTNQHCAFNDVRWMWFDNVYGSMGWVMVGGDTLVIRGCAANSIQQNPDNPHCRVGGDKATGPDSQDVWCIAAGPCSMPAPPSGTALQHTRILGGCAYDGNCNPVNTYPYTNNNLAQLYGGFGIGDIIDLSGSQYVDVAGLELTTHNGQCARFGDTNPLPRCVRTGTMNDQSDQGLITSASTANVLLQDLYIHGFSSNGISGPIGGLITVTRVSIDFNTFAGWNFDIKDSNGVSIPNAAGATLVQSYVTMIGNGCQEEYPIVHTQFPARGCWDTQSGGFGDSWSGQDSLMDTFTCDHCNISYNTKDGAMGPHTVIHTIRLTNSTWVANMGQNGKWGQDANATFLFQNNTIVGNCERMSQPLPGAAMNFDISSNVTGAGLSGYCRAAGSVFDYYADAGSTVNFNNNTVVTYQPTIFEMGCRQVGTCSTAPYNFTNNLVLGYIGNYTIAPLNSGQAPGLFYKDDSSVVIAGANNVVYGIRNDNGLCGNNSNLCNADPLLVNEPAQGSIPPEAILDNFNFHPTAGSPAVKYGTSYTGAPTLDYYGNPQTSPLTVGAVAP